VGGTTHNVTMLICYEDILPGFTNAAVKKGDPELLVNITNDAWFGDTAEPWEHLALAQLRAIEHRRFFVRGTNSGVSAVIDPVGRVVAHSGVMQQETVLAPIRWIRSRTVYELVGDWLWYAISALVTVWAFKRRTVPLKA
jgi:apolipoprotein N-acyltransferase